MDADFLLTAAGLLYGLALIATMFIRTGFTEALRIDALFTGNPTEMTRPLNLVAGLCFVGYSLFTAINC